jgi:hypothetical protein
VQRHLARRSLALWIGLALVALTVWSGATLADQPAAIEKRLAETAGYLASDQLEGRGLGTKGLELAADYIASQFARAGLNTAVVAGSPYLKFRVTTSVKLGKTNRLHLAGPAKEPGKSEQIDLKPGADFTPMAPSGSGPLELPMVFAGYGITAKAQKYDDYCGVDAAGKAVIILRHEPRQADSKSVFGGTRPSLHAWFTHKIANATEHKAGAIIFCEDGFAVQKSYAEARKKWQEALDRLAHESTEAKKAAQPSLGDMERQRLRVEELGRQVAAGSESMRAIYDRLLPFEAAGRHCPQPPIPVICCRRSVLDRVLQASAGADLAGLEQKIDAGPTPQSRALAGWKIQGEVQVDRVESEARNVIATREGQGPSADETVVLGAHYDHLGKGQAGPRASLLLALVQAVERVRSGTTAPLVYHGADDNASGVAVLVEVARSIGALREKPRRRIAFVAFSAEEAGLIGSDYFVVHSPFPLQKTVAMINLDMVGRLRDEKLTVGGAGSANCFGELLDQLNRPYGFQISKTPAGTGPSDQLPFYAHQVPVMHFFTGLHSDYHRPTDVAERLNYAGMRRIAGLVTDLTLALANGEGRPQFVAPAPPAPAEKAPPASRGTPAVSPPAAGGKR